MVDRLFAAVNRRWPMAPAMVDRLAASVILGMDPEATVANDCRSGQIPATRQRQPPPSSPLSDTLTFTYRRTSSPPRPSAATRFDATTPPPSLNPTPTTPHHHPTTVRHHHRLRNHLTIVTTSINHFHDDSRHLHSRIFVITIREKGFVVEMGLV
nr:hypothetical protein [Tanacetum cinerariifolium]